MKSKDLIKSLKAHGWVHVRTVGSHYMFEKEGNANTIAVPHPKKDLGKGLVRKIMILAGI